MALNYNKFILFGDSITQFTSAQDLTFALQPALQDLYSRKLDIINRGFSGYNSEHAKFILPKILEHELNEEKNNIKLLTIFFGTNDTFQIDDKINEIQAISIERYRENLVAMVKLCIENNIKPIIIGPTLHDNRLSRIGYVASGRDLKNDSTTNKRNHEYSKTAASVAQEYGVPFLDLWKGFQNHGGWTEEQLYSQNGNVDESEYINLSSLLHDGIHLTGEGYKILYKELIRIINDQFPHMNPDNLPLNLPYWMDIDPKNVSSSLFK